MVSRTTWVLIIIFVVLLGAAWVFQRSKSNAAASPTPTTPVQTLFENIDSNGLTKVQITDAQGKTVIFQRSDAGDWALIEPQAELADPTQVGSTISSFVSARILNELSSVPELNLIGLGSTAYNVSVITSDGQQHLAQIGGLTSTGSGYYVLVKGRPVVVVSKSTVDSFLDLLNNPPVATPSPVATQESNPTEAPTPTP